ncbi:hypothetical protein [Afifella sp. IM 167]|uniref:hypothetical protein n=1 Tax=Afifella sp. IM 167 TaxID=2033586 RepID=UPI001CCA55B4|nr:hypothetical protein [Afifella sp. IM 167]MBZ8134872.1 hypothetical protein [Afifella sp. IM 167]
MSASLSLVRRRAPWRSALALLALVCAFTGALSPSGAMAGQGATVLTVTGAVGASNRPPFEAFRDALFAAQDQHFDKAYAFDRDMLAALPQESVRAEIEGWPKAVELKGPSLASVLRKAGVGESAELTLFALDGYNVALAGEDRARYKWILAIEAGGEPLALGGRGPSWLVRDTGGSAATADAESPMVWALYHIKAE